MHESLCERVLRLRDAEALTSYTVCLYKKYCGLRAQFLVISRFCIAIHN